MVAQTAAPTLMALRSLDWSKAVSPTARPSMVKRNSSARVTTAPATIAPQLTRLRTGSTSSAWIGPLARAVVFSMVYLRGEGRRGGPASAAPCDQGLQVRAPHGAPSPCQPRTTCRPLGGGPPDGVGGCYSSS